MRRASVTDDEQTWLIVANSDTEPGETYLFDRKNRNSASTHPRKLPRESWRR